MNTKEIDNKKDLYRSPSVEVIGVSSERIICTSGTEGYGINNDQPLTDGDFE